jgi:hypothetical protein
MAGALERWNGAAAAIQIDAAAIAPLRTNFFFRWILAMGDNLF